MQTREPAVETKLDTHLLEAYLKMQAKKPLT